MTPQIRLMFGRRGGSQGTFVMNPGDVLIAEGTDVFVSYPPQEVEIPTPNLLIGRKDCAKLRGLLDARRSLLAYEFNFGYRGDEWREELAWIEEMIARLDKWREEN